MQNGNNRGFFFWGGGSYFSPPPPPAVYILNAALLTKKGGITCDKVKFGTAIEFLAYNFSIKHYTSERANLHCDP